MSICYWTVADGKYADMMSAVVHSARQVGVTDNFHVWSDKKVWGAITHDCGEFDKSHYMFKIDFLKNEVKKLFYDYFIFIDADSWFVRNPGNILAQLRNSPVHICMESNCDNPYNIRKDWWGCELPKFCELMRNKGVRCSKIYNCNAGFWIVHRDAIDTVHRLCWEFWNYADSQGYKFTEEAPLSYVGHMMHGNPHSHTLTNNTEVWASDWMGHFKDRIPVDEAWDFRDYMTMEEINVRPAIVHAMRSKDELIKFGSRL